MLLHIILLLSNSANIANSIKHISDYTVPYCGNGGEFRIYDLSQLNGCSKINGSLLLSGTVYGFTTAKITQITKCIFVKHTDLDNLDFLQIEPSKNNSCSESCLITGNTYLCNIKRIEDTIRNACSSQYVKFNGEKCEERRIHCPGGNASKIRRKNCVVIDGDLIIDSNIGSLNHLRKIKKINGQLIIYRTSHKSITLESLETVESPNAPAILVQHNDLLETLHLPNLKSAIVTRKLPSHDSRDVDIRFNEKLNKSASASSSRRLKMKVKLGNEEEYDNRRRKKYEEDEISNGQKILLFGVGTCLLLLFVSAILFIHSLMKWQRHKMAKVEAAKLGPPTTD